MSCASTVRAKQRRGAEVVRRLAQTNSLLVLRGGRLGDFSTILATFERKRYFTQLDWASGFNQVPQAEADRHKTTFRDS